MYYHGLKQASLQSEDGNYSCLGIFGGTQILSNTKCLKYLFNLGKQILNKFAKTKIQPRYLLTLSYDFAGIIKGPLN